MKKILLTLSMTALLLFTAGCSCPFSDKTADSKPQMNTAAASAAETAPDFSYKELGSGKTMRLSDLKGKPVFINFWATWCPPCVGELPHIEKKYVEYKDRMHFVILSVDDNEQEPARFIQSKGYYKNVRLKCLSNRCPILKKFSAISPSVWDFESN